MPTENSTFEPNDVVININTGFPVKSSSGQATEFEKAYVTRPFRPHRRIHTFNRSPILSNITKDRPKPFRFKHKTSSPVKVNFVSSDKEKSRVKLQAKYANKFERLPTPIPRIPTPPPMPQKKEKILFDNELVKAVIDPVIDPVEPWNKNDMDEKVELKKVTDENMVDKIFKEFESNVFEKNEFINRITNSETFQKFVNGTKNEVKNVIDDMTDISTGMFDQLFKNLTEVTDSDDEMPPLESLSDTDSDNGSNYSHTEDSMTNKQDIDNSSEFFNEMANDWKKFNEDILNTTWKAAPAPVAANGFSSDFAQFESKTGKFTGDSLLQNDGDLTTANIYRSIENDAKKLNNKIGFDKRIYVKQLSDNFEATNDNLITPGAVIEELIKVKNRVMSCRDSEDVNIELTTVCVNPNIVSKVRGQYYRQYPNDNRSSDKSQISIWTNPSIFYNAVQQDFGMKRGRLLSVLDKMIAKYRCLADDRKILDQATEIGEEIVDVVEEYKEVQTRLKKLNDFNEKIDQVRKNLVELSNMSMDLEEFEGFKEINNNLLNEVRCFQDGLSRSKIEELKNEAEQCQAKFNYYQKMSQTIVDRIKLITEMPMSDFSRFNLQEPNDLEECKYNPMKFKEEKIDYKRYIYNPKKIEPLVCKFHEYPFDLKID